MTHALCVKPPEELGQKKPGVHGFAVFVVLAGARQ